MQSSLGQQNIQQQQFVQQPTVQQQSQIPVQAQQNSNYPQQNQTNPIGPQVLPQQNINQNQATPYQASPIGSQIQGQPQGQNVQLPNYSGVNIQIFNPSVATPGATAPVYNVNAPSYAQQQPVNGCYPSNYYTNNLVGNTKPLASTDANSTEKKKTEKKEIVQLTDDYIRNLENYLNSQDKEVRLMGAKEVIARLEEDKSRKDDKALNALVNKMLQDPSTQVRILALGALDSRIVTGDDFTVGVLKQMQNSTSGYGQDAMQATNILLKMSGQKVEKEFEVPASKQTEKKSENK